MAGRNHLTFLPALLTLRFKWSCKKYEHFQLFGILRVLGSVCPCLSRPSQTIFENNCSSTVRSNDTKVPGTTLVRKLPYVIVGRHSCAAVSWGHISGWRLMTTASRRRNNDLGSHQFNNDLTQGGVKVTYWMSVYSKEYSFQFSFLSFYFLHMTSITFILVTW
jgi:hypothetical protein